MKVVELVPAVTQCEPFRRDRLSHLPATQGCYVLATLAGDVLYAGLAKNLRTRMEQHLDTPAKVAPTSQGRAVQFYWLETNQPNAVERGWLNSHLLVTGVLPILNKVASPVSS